MRVLIGIGQRIAKVSVLIRAISSSDSRKYIVSRVCSVTNIHLVTLNGSTYNARYDDFKISDEDSGYKLSLGKFSGNLNENALRNGENMKFTTFDRDNDKYGDGNCAVDYKSGWWYTKCSDCILNAPYGPDLVWWVKTEIKIKEAKMLIRPKEAMKK
ncbi:fibrinogen-like protein 1 isoform X2 [Drosophila sulfurigaster albostrigata]|uniref:fibrinogen-like protein 1 isoform X2 n=1 Tax=Drosophila sulfurigaster albostrigata TaxID=89887 RepID=UPI002D219AD8|nr:fibrinogen-like protein 1 isoform X2 [Drosophila sulfurigaster albostrigata]